MIGVIMAGGSGTRLKPLTSQRPKPMLPVLNKPMMEYIVHLLADSGINKAVATLYYRPNDVKDYFTDGSEWGVDLGYSLEKEPLGTAGSVKLAHDKMCFNETVLVISGDGLTDFDLNYAYEQHKKSNAKVSILLKKVDNPLEFGVVVKDKNGFIEKFIEKPGRGQVVSDLVNTGMYIIEPEILEEIPEGESFDFAQDLFPKLLEKDVNINGIEMEGYWADIGDLKQYIQAQMDILEGKVKLKIPGRKIADGVWIGEHVELHDEKQLMPPVFIGNNCRVGKDAVVGPFAVIGDNVVFEPRARMQRSIVMANSFIGENAELEGAILGRSVLVEMGVNIQDGAVIADNCTLGEQSTVQAGVFIWPTKIVESQSVVTNDLVWSRSHQAAIFAGNNVRGLANIRLTPQFALRLAMAFGTVLGRNSLVVVSRDGSRASRLIKRAMTAGFMAMGVDVIDLHGTLNSLCRYAVRSFNANGSCHIRISAEHPEVIQLEFYDNEGFPLSRDIQRKVEALHSRGDFPIVKVDNVGSIHYRPGFIANYVEEALRHTDKNLISERQFSIVMDYNFGASSQIVPHLLEPLSCELITLRPYAEGGASRSIEEAEAKERVVRITRLNADLGILMDSHGQKFSLIDELGNIHSPEIVRMLLLQRKLETGNEQVVLPMHWADSYKKIVLDGNQEFIKAKVDWGDMIRTASSAMNSTGEWVSFHHYYQEVDGPFALLKILEIVADKQKPLSKIIANLPEVNVFSKSVRCSWEKMGSVLRQIAEKYSHSDIDTHDGIKVRSKKGWFLVVPDSYRPRFIISAEGKKRNESRKLLGEIEKLLIKYIESEDS